MNKLNDFAVNFFQEYHAPSVVEWAESNAFLSERITEQSGLYSTAQYPFVREILEAFADEDVRRISLCWGSQTSKTTTLYVGMGYFIDQKPSPMLWVMATDAMARTFTQDRLIPFLEDSPKLAAHLPKTFGGRIDKNNVTQGRIQFNRCSLNLVGGQTKANVRSFPVSVLLLDEIDIIPEACRREALDRVKGRRDYKVIQSSTPLEETTGIWGEYLAGDQRRYLIPCPHCGEYIPLDWKSGPDKWNLKCDKDYAKLERGWDYKKVMETTFYHCQKCDGKIDDAQKAYAMNQGKWEPQSSTNEIGVRSYHLSSLYSPTLRFGEILTKWLQAQGEVEGVKNFVQGWLAEPWKDELMNVSPERVMELSKEYDRGEIKGEMRILSVDVQRSHFWWIVRGFDPNGESYLIDHGMAPTFADLDEAFANYQCRYGIVDTGYGDRTQEMYEQLWMRRSQWFGIKGWATMTLPYKINLVDPFTGTNKASQAKIRLIHINVGVWQGELGARRAGKTKGWNLYNQVDPTYIKQITSVWQHESVDRKGKVKQEWRTKSHADDHYWDCEVYALGFAKLIGFGNIPKIAGSDQSSKATNPRPKASSNFW